MTDLISFLWMKMVRLRLPVEVRKQLEDDLKAYLNELKEHMEEGKLGLEAPNTDMGGYDIAFERMSKFLGVSYDG
jgi:hypothetical protein